VNADAARSQSVAHDRAFSDWLEAEAIVATLRRSAAAASERAAERSRAATALARAGRGDAFALGVADAAQILAQRAAAEARRLEEAIRTEALLRGRVYAARRALDAAAVGEEPRRERSPACE
jgi:hypothetical protein